MTYEEFQAFQEWQAEKGKQRSVKIAIEPPGFMGGLRIWVYDYELLQGQFVSSAAEIDLEGIAERKERERLAELLAKYPEVA